MPRLRDAPRNARGHMTTCLHEDHIHACPFCAGVVDPDTQVCSTCREMVAAVPVCAYCGDEIGAVETSHA